jgi:GLPGLI family protein
MKNITLLILFFSTLSFSQEFQGKATYFSKIILENNDEKISPESKKEIDPALDKAFQEALKKASEKSYLLTFNKSECIYEQEQQLEKPKPASGEMSISVSFSTSEGKKYINAKNKTSITEDEIFDKEFLIVETIEKPDWKLVDESKKIGD